MWSHGYDKLQYSEFSTELSLARRTFLTRLLVGVVVTDTVTCVAVKFAAMFPNHVEGLVIDGVADAEDHYSGLWSRSLLVTDLALRMILDACVALGPLRCAPTDKVHARFTAIFNGFKEQSLLVYDNKAEGALHAAPLTTRWHDDWESKLPSMDLLHALAQVEKGDELPLARLLGIAPVHAPFTRECSDSSRSLPDYITADAVFAIACADSGPARTVDTVEDLEEHFVCTAKAISEREAAEGKPGLSSFLF
ncbi:uncharacterized protein PHACADRAFT_199798 [Phanerochaete carnosa HHB-10118-sp]|uniref:Uncharacterized protein n=1 Tax=Phanerochaete carnosa (strain HHB-10118-sp) TaxID=650164 RepID=K5UMP6_PHACS|nr:uncharacterized protein PHACADRAFT_199798 [Phanerochaete carnosa HHB-10118-sp]EKM50971.1 hypothetical protein PHACADRAFT_199798 [Phanerochaete carnosa HHB-10118-sp]